MSLEVTNVDKVYGAGETSFKALDEVSLSVKKGDVCVILGPSGSGKSTLLNILGGIDRVSSGRVLIGNLEITSLNDDALTDYRRESVGFVFQFYNLIPNLTVGENVEVAANVCENPENIDTILEAVGMKEMKNRFPRELSGGQQQRVSVARALVKRPKLLLCDEPTGALDFNTSREVLKLISDVNKSFGTTVIIITHNNSIAAMANKVIRIRSGKITENYTNNNMVAAERIEW